MRKRLVKWTVGIFTHQLAHQLQTLLSGSLLTPEDDMSLADLLLILGESPNSCCSQHVSGYLSDGALMGGGPLLYQSHKQQQKTVRKYTKRCWTSDFFELSLLSSLQTSDFPTRSILLHTTVLSPLSHVSLFFNSLLYLLSLPAASLSADV